MCKPIAGRVVFIFFIFIASQCNREEAAPFTTGLKVLKGYDLTRTFDTTITIRSGQYYRPVKIDLFYPSIEKPSHPSLTYGDFLDMYEQRIDFNKPLDSCKKTSMEIATAISEYLLINSTSKILNYRTQVYYDLKLPRKKYPLIIYASGMNGSTWENPILFDTLVRNGYVVASISSVGKFPGYMSDPVDIGEQVKDILYTIDQLKIKEFVDDQRIGILSWSLGGTAAIKAAMVSKDIKCLLSFDGTEIHYYGFDTAWDKQYNQMMEIPPYSPEKITIPYLYLSSEHPKKIDSVYLFPNHIKSTENFFLKFKSSIHEDFSSVTYIAKILKPSLKNINAKYHRDIMTLTLLFYDQYLKQKSAYTIPSYIKRLVESNPSLYTTQYPAGSDHVKHDSISH